MSIGIRKIGYITRGNALFHSFGKMYATVPEVIVLGEYVWK